MEIARSFFLKSLQKQILNFFLSSQRSEMYTQPFNRRNLEHTIRIISGKSRTKIEYMIYTERIIAPFFIITLATGALPCSIESHSVFRRKEFSCRQSDFRSAGKIHIPLWNNTVVTTPKTEEEVIKELFIVELHPFRLITFLH